MPANRLLPLVSMGCALGADLVLIFVLPLFAHMAEDSDDLRRGIIHTQREAQLQWRETAHPCSFTDMEEPPC